jgi:hypothetical protein
MDHQVDLDVQRSLHVNYVQRRTITEEERDNMRGALERVINGVIASKEGVHYYQGFSDICSVLLLLLGERDAFQVAVKLSQSYLRDFMTPTLGEAMNVLALLLPLLHCVDDQVATILQSFDTPIMAFALPWILTWFSHSIDNVTICARIYDVLLSHSPLLPVYISVAIILTQRVKSTFTLCPAW